MCVQDVDDQCVLQFTLVNAVGCALHRRTSRVIHRLELVTVPRRRPGGQSSRSPFQGGGKSSLVPPRVRAGHPPNPPVRGTRGSQGSGGEVCDSRGRRTPQAPGVSHSLNLGLHFGGRHPRPGALTPACKRADPPSLGQGQVPPDWQHQQSRLSLTCLPTVAQGFHPPTVSLSLCLSLSEPLVCLSLCHPSLPLTRVTQSGKGGGRAEAVRTRDL